eukprot:6073817-Prymnesium_polylepis.1
MLLRDRRGQGWTEHRAVCAQACKNGCCASWLPPGNGWQGRGRRAERTPAGSRPPSRVAAASLGRVAEEATAG